jgi:hypothetical protein
VARLSTSQQPSHQRDLLWPDSRATPITTNPSDDRDLITHPGTLGEVDVAEVQQCRQQLQHELPLLAAEAALLHGRAQRLELVCVVHGSQRHGRGLVGVVEVRRRGEPQLLPQRGRGAGEQLVEDVVAALTLSVLHLQRERERERDDDDDTREKVRPAPSNANANALSER